MHARARLGTSEPRASRISSGVLACIVLLCGVTLTLGFANKYRCAGPEFDAAGRSAPNYNLRNWLDACYSDIQFLWLGRGINEGLFPYVNGGITDDGTLTGSAVEYPVLSGLLMWVGALFAETDAGFLLGSALLLAPFGLLTALLLGTLTGLRALWWALGPPLVLYAFHNWDMAAVACAVAAFYVVFGMRSHGRSLRRRAGFAAVLLGIGFAVKIYPAIFVLPLALYVATGGEGGDSERDDSDRDDSEREEGQATPSLGRPLDVRGALRVLGIAIGTAAAINLPFAVAGFEGWRASFVFQSQRAVDATTNTVWYWAFRPHSDPDNELFQSVVGVASPLLIVAAFTVACIVGMRRYRLEGTFPMLGVSGAMLCAFLLLHTVHSPQYTLWLLPMLVLVRVRSGWIVAYLVADLALGVGIFRMFGELNTDGAAGIWDGLAAQAVMIGVWGRAALLVGLFIAFLGARAAVHSAPSVSARSPRGSSSERVYPSSR